MKLSKEQHQRLEEIGNELEGIVQSLPEWKVKTEDWEYSPEKKLFQIAWDVKQVAKAGIVKDEEEGLTDEWVRSQVFKQRREYND